MSIFSDNKGHQTAVLIKLPKNKQEQERATRLVDSLNRAGSGPGSTIKADIYTVLTNGTVVPGLVFTEPVTATDDQSLRDQATAAGYVQVVIA